MEEADPDKGAEFTLRGLLGIVEVCSLSASSSNLSE